MPRLVISLLLLLVLLPAAPASAARAPVQAKFEASFEAKRVVEWKQPRGVNLVDCKGEHFREEGGSEAWSIKTARPQKVLVTGGVGRSGMTLWTYGSWDPRKPALGQFGIEAAGLVKRDYSLSSGTTGGDCDPVFRVDPQRPDDCGTRLPRYTIGFSNLAGAVLWSHTTDESMRRENLRFSTCNLVTPDKVREDQFPPAPATFSSAKLFNKSLKRIVITGSKTFGPTFEPIPNFGVERTSTAKVTWKLTLVRKK